MEEVVARIRSERKRQKITAKAFAAKLGITTVHLCNVEMGKSIPSLDLLAKMLETLRLRLVVTAAK